MDIRDNLDKEREEHFKRNNSSECAKHIKDELKGKDKNWNRCSGAYLGYDARIRLMEWVNRLQSCHTNAIVDFNKQLDSFVRTYEIAHYEEEIRISKKVRDVKPDLVKIEVPWFTVTTLLPKIFYKYFKGAYHKFKHTDGSPFEDFITLRDKAAYISPSNNPEYKWIKGWEFGIEPFGHKNLRSFMKARLKEKKKYLKNVVEAKLKEKERLEKEKEEEIKFKKQQEETERLCKKYSKAYENLDEKDGECYVICEIEKVFTKIKNKANCLYTGETENFAARRKNYRDFSKPNNEIVNKLVKKFPKMTREEIVNKLKNNIKVKRLKFKSLQHPGYRKHIEGYLIHRLKPLLNTSKINSSYYKDRSFVVWEEGTGIRTASGSPATNRNLF